MRASGYARAASDWYVEPAWCVEALQGVERFTGGCWDPACGGGTIPRTLNGLGVDCVGSDIVDRGYGSQMDFLAVTTRALPGLTSIVSNPPYGIIVPWIEKALSLTTDRVAILARLALLEGRARRDFFTKTPLARVHVSSRRISMPPGERMAEMEAKGGSIAYAWFVWDHAHKPGTPYAGGWI